MKKRNLILYLSIVVILICIAFSASYAYFTATITGNDTAKTTQVTSGTLDIDFTTSAYISNSNLFLIDDADKATKADATTFTVANSNGNVSGKYNLVLTELAISDNLKSQYFKWELLKNDTAINNGDFTSAVTGTDFNLTSTSQTIAVNSTDSYILRIWLSESNTNQISLTSGSFSAKVKMVATN